MVKGAIFQNRAAMKMANMDAVFDFMFSCPRDEDQVSWLDGLSVTITYITIRPVGNLIIINLSSSKFVYKSL